MSQLKPSSPNKKEDLRYLTMGCYSHQVRAYPVGEGKIDGRGGVLNMVGRRLQHEEPYSTVNEGLSTINEGIGQKNRGNGPIERVPVL